MMTLGLMRVRNEARWIRRCIESMLPVCDSVLVMDDHSTDGTADICAAIPGVTVLLSPFDGLNETRDKNWLLSKARALDPQWILMIDGDEMLTPGCAGLMLRSIKTPNLSALSMRVLYLWDAEDQVRTDGVYSHFWRPSMFRLTAHEFQSNGANGGFHCGNVPSAQQLGARRIDAPLLHFGYMHREDRIRKFHWYRGIDGQNVNEDGYAHMVLGDLPEYPANSVRRHGGPLRLEALGCATTVG